MSSKNRRRFLKSSAAVTAGFFGLRAACGPNSTYAAEETADEKKEKKAVGYGRLFSDPKGILDLPDGFSYSIISKEGEEMNDGLVVPGAPDGMATFQGPYGLTVIIRNHELTPDNPGPFGKDRKLMSKVSLAKLYDAGHGKTPSSGGTTTIVYDTDSKKKIREFLSLGGTIRNCAGGPTPWKSWVSCEETLDKVGTHGEEKDEADKKTEKKDNDKTESPEKAERRKKRQEQKERNEKKRKERLKQKGIVDPKVYYNEKDHGYNFEVPVSAKIELAEPIPLTDMGRFHHEAIAVDPRTGIVYETEDRDDGLFYRFIPNKAGQLREGGKLQAMVLMDKRSADTRNWDEKEGTISTSTEYAVKWLDIQNVKAPEDDLRAQGFAAGAARFARGEGIWYGDGELYFACTSGGREKIGQIFKYRPSYDEGTANEEKSPGKLQLFIEPNDTELIHNADNLTIAPWGDLVVCEDRQEQVIRLVGVTPVGECYTIAMSHMNTEFAGCVFSPDGSTLFVNIQGVGMTLAITGPWQTLA